MNDLEEQIYREATRAAAEVTQADVPPLRLRPMRWSGAGRGAAGRRVLIPLAAAASVAVVISVVIVAGHQSPGGAKHVRPPVAQTKRTAVAADRRLVTEALDWYFPASGATYAKGLAFSWAEEKTIAHDIRPCLAAAGFPQPPYGIGVRDFQLAFPDNSEFPDVALLAIHPEQVYLKQWPVLMHPTSARLKALGVAQRQCTARFATRVTRIDKAARTLQGTWSDIITLIEHSAAVTATQPPFARCLEAHGVPVSLASQTDNAASNPLFTGYFAWADGLNQTTTSNKQYLADYHHEVKVFIACLPPALTVLEKIQLDHRIHFFRQNATQIARITRLVEEMSAPSH